MTYLDVLASHPPDTLGKPLGGVVLGGMFDTAHIAKEISTLHSKTHIVDTILLNIREVPIHSLSGNLVEGTLLNLNHEVLAVLNLRSRKVVETTCLYVQLTATLRHTDKFLSFL